MIVMCTSIGRGNISCCDWEHIAFWECNDVLIFKQFQSRVNGMNHTSTLRHMHRNWRMCKEILRLDVDEELRGEQKKRIYARIGNFLPHLNSIEYSLTVFAHMLEQWLGRGCNKCVHPKLWLKGCFCVIKMHNKKARNHEINWKSRYGCSISSARACCVV